MPESKLTFIKRTSCDNRGHYKALYRCSCGNTTETRIDSVESGKAISCGCYRKTKGVKHGFTSNPLYKVWYGMKDRCYNPKRKAYKDYGGRGITICDEWLNDLLAFIKWCEENGWEKGLEIDRENNDLGYEPSNCRFVTSKKNCNNRRNNILVYYMGKNQTVKAWAEELNLNYHLILSRINKGFSPEDAFKPPSRLRGINKREIERKIKRQNKLAHAAQ